MDTRSKIRQQLEAQARQQSKQQSQPNVEVNNSTVQKGVSSKANLKSEIKDKESIQNDDKFNVMEAKPRFSKGRTALNERQQDVVNAIMKSDGLYEPSTEALANTSIMLKQVYGLSMSNYKGGKELVYKKSSISVYAGRPISIPVRVSIPGTFIEFTIDKKASEFDFGILAVPDKGYAVNVKVNLLFLLLEPNKILYICRLD